jgi:hypothetical protein
LIADAKIDIFFILPSIFVFFQKILSQKQDLITSIVFFH